MSDLGFTGFLAAPGRFIIPPKRKTAQGGAAQGAATRPLRVRPLRRPQPASGLYGGALPCARFFFWWSVACARAGLGPGRVSPLGFLPCLLFVFGLVGRGRRVLSFGSVVGFGVVRVRLFRFGGGGGRGGRGFRCGGSWSGSGLCRGVLSGRCLGCWRCRVSGFVVRLRFAEPVSVLR